MLNGPGKEFDMVKVQDSGVHDTERSYKGSYRDCWRDKIKSSQAFIQAVLLMSVFWTRLSFQMLQNAGWGLEEL